MERFWSKVDKSGNCWLWNASKTRNGYGKFSYEQKWWMAHRVSWLLTRGEFDKNLKILHKCDNPPCVNPDHLFIGTQVDNLRDMFSKGRARYGIMFGEENGCAKLTDIEVKEIRERHATGLHPHRHLAIMYNVSPTLILNIIHRKNWKHI